MKTNFKRIGKQSISIVLAVMMMLSTMLVGMVTSNAAISYWVLRGTFNNWNEVSFGGADGGSTIYDLSNYKGKTVEFRTDAYENNKLFMNSTGGTVEAGKEYQLTWDKGDTMKYTVSSTGTGKVKFTVISKNNKNYLTVTEEDQSSTEPTTPASDIVVYFANPVKGGWDTVCNYIWNTSGNPKPTKAWPGDNLTNVCQRDYSYKNVTYTVYKVTVPAAYNSIIFNNGSNNKQTGDIKGEILADRNLYIYNQSSQTANVDIIKNYTEPTTQKYTVAVDSNIKNGTVTTSATSLAAGKTFTVTATPDNGYVLNAITVTDADGKSVAATDESTHTYTMPASNVTVSATFKVKTDTKYSVAYTAPTGEGVVSASIAPTDTTLAEGTPVTVTVTVNEGYTASLAVDGATVTTSTSGNIYTFTFTMPAQDITVAPQVTKAGENTGTEIPDRYLIYSDSSSNPSDFTNYLNLYRDANDQVYAYFDESKFDDSKTYYFMISNSKGESTSWEYAYEHYNNSKASSDSEYLNCGQSEQWVLKEGAASKVHVFFARFSVLPAYVGTISSVKINLGYYNGTDIVENSTDSTTKATTYEVIPTSGAGGMVQVFAKDGTIRKQYVNNKLVNFQKYADMADTVLENGADLTKYDNKNEYYESASAKVGTKLKIKTTILPEYRKKYFVKAFSINGYSYGIIDASKADITDGVYTCEYTIPEDFEGKRIEITPIYYYIEEKDTVTFYVEGFDGKVQEMWGNTIAVQAWYKNGDEGGESGSDTKNALGGYPGQPLVYQGGKYSMQIPKCLNDKKANYVMGITLNNYFFDDIHKQSFTDQSDKYNCQTYDFNDFYKLSETPDVDNIIFDFRYRTTFDGDKEGNEPGNDLNSSNYNPAELELLKDYSGNIVNIFGNILSEDLTADYEKKHLTVISNGYTKITGIGNYATEWSVYDVDGTYITTINCSSLINENKVDTDNYTEAYNKLKQYKDLPVMIAYEKSLYGGGDKGTRADGRWYFSKKTQKITANVQIEYGTDVNSVFNVDEFKQNSNEGTVTGAKAYFTNVGYSGKTTCDGTVDGGNFSVHAQTDANAKYYFLGWYLKTSDGYSPITTESDADFPMTNNETYVARFIPTPSGALTLSHTLLTDSADGKTFIKADIVDSNGKVIKPFEETSGNIVIPSSYVTYTSKYSIKVTLRTEPYGKDTVEGFYNSAKERYTDVEAGVNTCVKSTTIKELFDTSSFKLIKSNIPFYSNIKSNPQEYTITYTYDTRLNGTRNYVIKDTVSGAELEKMWDENVAAGLSNKEQLSKAFIIRKAPFVSNYRVEITWNMDKATINGYTATVSATPTTDKLKIFALPVAGDYAGQWTQPATVEYGELAKSNGDYLYKTGTNEFPETFNYSGNTDYAFSFWAIFDNKDAAQKYNDAVKAYMSGTPDKNMSQRLTKLTNLEGYEYLISKSYSKEYNYISYQDYYIVPVYADRFAKNEINESQASIRLLEYTRNQWTTGDGVKGDGETLNTGANKTDYLYTDFALSFDKNQLLIKNNPNIKVGIALELVAQYKDIDLKNYVTDSDKNKIGNLVKTATDDGKVGTYAKDGADRSVYRYEIKNSNISVKNRIEYYLEFDNDDKAQQYVMKVYSYIYDTKSGDIFLSDPEYMNMYDIGNLTYIASIG